MKKSNPIIIDLVQDADGVFRDPLQPREMQPIEFEFDKDPGDWHDWGFNYRLWKYGALKPMPIIASGVA